MGPCVLTTVLGAGDTVIKIADGFMLSKSFQCFEEKSQVNRQLHHSSLSAFR